MTPAKLHKLLVDAKFCRNLARSAKRDAERCVAWLRSELDKAEASLATQEAELAAAEVEIAQYESLLPPPRKPARTTKSNQPM